MNEVQPGTNEIESGKKEERDPDGDVLLRARTFRASLELFFPLPLCPLETISELLYGRGFANVLALDESLGSLWAQSLMNIQPLPSNSQEDDCKRLELQFLRFNEEDPVFAKSIYEVKDAGAEESREDRDPPQRICTGYVYVLETKDLINHPLPSRALFTLQYHLHEAHHAFKAKSVL